jgi:N5-(carboxyethyl)ornithine synthase
VGSKLRIGVLRTSFKENERRVPIHPDHLGWIPKNVRKSLVFETDYGIPFGIGNAGIATRVGGMATREEIIADFDVVLLLKPVEADLLRRRTNGVLVGWVHCVQQRAHTQAAIDRRLTIIGLASMHLWDKSGERHMHIFSKNNELAGYAGIIHVMHIMGLDGYYGEMRKVLVISYGSVSRGAIFALQARGFKDITVFTQRDPNFVRDQEFNSRYRRLITGSDGKLWSISPEGNKRPFLEDLSSADIIVNGILQDTDRPLMYLAENEVSCLKPGSIIIDISCDEGMGFPFARPTTFDDPVFQIGKSTYYSVDHTPSYLWNSASWEISKCLLPFLERIVMGPDQWKKDETIRRAIEIEGGVIMNPKILSFQNRSAQYPHEISGYPFNRSSVTKAG